MGAGETEAKCVCLLVAVVFVEGECQGAPPWRLPAPAPRSLVQDPTRTFSSNSAGLPGPPLGSAHLGAVWNPLKPPGSSGAQIFEASPNTPTPSQLLKHLLCVCQLLLGRATLKSPLPPRLSSPTSNPGTQAFIQITGQILLPQSCGCLVPIYPN